MMSTTVLVKYTDIKKELFKNSKIGDINISHLFVTGTLNVTKMKYDDMETIVDTIHNPIAAASPVVLPQYWCIEAVNPSPSQSKLYLDEILEKVDW